jgi:hypothetical protein
MVAYERSFQGVVLPYPPGIRSKAALLDKSGASDQMQND